MDVLKRLFTETKMSWLRVVVFALVCGVAVGLLMIPDALDGTSLQQPGISFEFWIAAALFVILNCKDPKEAALKTFVFFLLSQPLIYLVQVPFGPRGWEIFQYYPRWGILTLCTLPGAYLAWYVKKGNGLSVAILTVANLILCLCLASFVYSLIFHFPHMLLSVLFVVGEILFFGILLFSGGKRTTALLLALLLFSGFFAYRLQEMNSHSDSYSAVLEGEPPFTVEGEYENARVAVDGNCITVDVDFPMSVDISLKDGKGDPITLEFSCFYDTPVWSGPVVQEE